MSSSNTSEGPSVFGKLLPVLLPQGSSLPLLSSIHYPAQDLTAPSDYIGQEVGFPFATQRILSELLNILGSLVCHCSFRSLHLHGSLPKGTTLKR